jgi:isopenicillin N synthase-like dioxygenase
MKPQDRPFDFNDPDPKWRFFWRMGIPPKTTKFKQLNADPVIPAAFPTWEADMNNWGNKLLDSVSVVAEMMAVGLGLPCDTFTKLAQNGPHLLAPTGSDLIKYGKVGTVLAGFHSDLNFLTIHGKSRFAGLHIWTRSGQKLLAKIPDGCLLVQAAKQLEYLTGGAILAGFHEVVVVEETIRSVEQQKLRGRPLWRISSTLFYHLASDHILEPLSPQFKDSESSQKYPSMYVGEQVQKELGFLELAK